MKILITGATGLIGKELVKLLLQNQHSVNYLTTSTSKIEKKKEIIKAFIGILKKGKLMKIVFFKLM